MEWTDISDQASPAQRRAIYRFVNDSDGVKVLVRSMTTAEAAVVLQAFVAVHKRIHQTQESVDQQRKLTTVVEVGDELDVNPERLTTS